MSRPYEVRPGRARGGARAWLLTVYNVVVTAGVVVLGGVLLVQGSAGQRVGGVVLVVAGGWWARSVAASVRRLRVPRDAAEPPVRLRLDDDGVTVLAETTDGGAEIATYVAWSDCVAVVASPAPARTRDSGPLLYVHFMPRSEAVVHHDGVPPQLWEMKARLCGIPVAPSAALAWVLVAHDAGLVAGVLDQVRARAPHVHVVDSTRHGLCTAHGTRDDEVG